MQPLNAELLAYVEDLFAPDSANLRFLTDSAKRAGMPEGWEISRDVGVLFQILCKAIGAKRVVEFGTLAGHSAYWLATALPSEGRVVSIELNPKYAEVARENLRQVGVGERVEVRVGAARDWLAPLEAEANAGEKFDAIFLDADKAHYPQFLAWAERVLRPGGLLLADNVLHSGSWGEQTLLDSAADDPRIIGIREFNRLLAESPRFTATIVPIRAGVAVGLFHG